jgi:hypothetical protein
MCGAYRTRPGPPSRDRGPVARFAQPMWPSCVYAAGAPIWHGKPPRPLYKHPCAQRHLVECCLSKLKQFRRVATRFEKQPEINYLAVVTIAAIVSWMR